MAVVFIALGIPFYIWARCEERDIMTGNRIARNRSDMNNRNTIAYQRAWFTMGEKILCGVIIIVALIAVYAFARGLVTL